MNKFKLILVLVLGIVLISGCGAEDPVDDTAPESISDVADGTYTGTAEGYRGDLTVEVVVEDGRITDIEVVDHDETESFFETAYEATPADIIEAQDFDIDTETGATFTSEAIVSAVRNALGLEEEAVDEEAVDEEEFDLSNIDDGVYSGAAEGFRGDDTLVEVVVENGEIIEVNLVEHNDTEVFVEMAEVTLADIVEQQTLDVDVRTGATGTSESIVSAAKNAFGLDIEIEEVEEVDIAAIDDGGYFGAAPGFREDDITVEVLVENGEITSLDILDHNDTQMFFDIAESTVQDILGEQSLDVDTRTGATGTSDSIVAAVRNALTEPFDTEGPVEAAPVDDEPFAEIPAVERPEDIQEARKEGLDFQDGTYRGIFHDRGYPQVHVQLVVEDNKVTDWRWRHLWYRDLGDYLDGDDELRVGIRKQYDQVMDYLVGKDIRVALPDLYEPGEFVEDFEADVDTFTGATVRSNKVVSAVTDALNRGVNRFREVGGEVPVDYSPIAGREFQDGTYRGIFNDRGFEQVHVQIVVEDNQVTDWRWRHLYYRDVGDYLDTDDPLAIDVRGQYDQLMDYLVGKDIRTALPDLYEPGEIVDDVDLFTGATVRSNKVIQAVVDALNKGVNRFREVGGEIPEGYSPLAGRTIEDGTYRGIFHDRGFPQVHVQFVVEDHEVTDWTWRHLYYRDVGDYLDTDDPLGIAVRGQYDQLMDYLVGKDIRTALPDLYEPDMVDDVDLFTGATVRSNKVIQAVVDGVNRGVNRFREVGGEVPEKYTPLRSMMLNMD